jgi:hypothetical protein
MASTCRPSSFVLRLLGSRLAIMAVALLAVGWFVSAPMIISDHARQRPFSTDYLSFHSAGSQIRHAPDDLYDIEAQRREQRTYAGPGDEGGFFEFRYPPLVALGFTPLSHMPVRSAYVAFVLLSFGALAACGLALRRLIPDVPRTRATLAVLCMLGSTASVTSLLVGQITPFLLLITLGSLLALRAEKATRAGVMLGLLSLKPHFAVAALLVVIAARQWRIAAGMCLSTAAILVASMLMVGVDTMRDYVALLVHTESGSTSVASEQNIYGLIATLTGAQGGSAVLAAHLVIAASAALLAARAVRRARYQQFEHVLYASGLGSMLILVASPHLQFYDLALLVLPALFVVHRLRHGDDQSRRYGYGLLVLGFGFGEFAGILASVGLSVSAPVLLAMLVALCNWETVEGVLLGLTDEAHDSEMPLAAAA